MYRLFLISLIAVITFFSYQQISFAVCVEGPTDTFTCNTNPPNPDPEGIEQMPAGGLFIVNVLPEAGIDTRLANGGNGEDCINGSSSDSHIITIDNGNLACEKSGIDSKSGSAFTIHIINNSIVAGGFDGSQEGIQTQAREDTINIDSSIVSSEGGVAIDTNIRDDILNVTNNSQVIAGQDPNSGSNDAIRMSSGNDRVTIENSIILGGNGGDSIDLGSGDDTVTLGTGAELIGIIDCGSGFDTIVFAMDVPEGGVAFISAQLATKNPAGDSITINNLFYQWEDCELLVNQLGVRAARPIPTLSEWGLIAMAGVLGIVGLMVIRRRKVAA